MRYMTTCPSPLGEVILASDGQALTGLWFAGQKYERRGLAPDAQIRALPVFDATRAWLARYFSGRDPGPIPPVSPPGTPFQREVWALLRTIPYGRTQTYGELAQALARQRGGRPVSPRAVGSAVGKNPVSILLPCHRVVGSGSKLTGYAGGLERKRALLRLEGAL